MRAPRIRGAWRTYEGFGSHDLLRQKGLADSSRASLERCYGSNQCLRRMFTSVTDLPLGGKHCILDGFAAFGEFFPRDYASFGVRQQFGQVDMEGLQ